MNNHHRKYVGNEGEDLIANYLEKQGFTIEERNYRKRGGEIDIIARNKDLIVFVEVKRRIQSYFNLSEVITVAKQYKIIQTARAYKAEKRLFGDFIFRFDVGLVEQYNNTPTITYIEDAFRASQGDFV